MDGTLPEAYIGNVEDETQRFIRNCQERKIIMKATQLLPAARTGAKKIPRGLALASVAMFPCQYLAATPMVDLQTASGFAILAGSQITDAGGASVITGDVGLYPATGAAIGLTAGQVDGAIYTAELNGALLNQAKNDLTTAYTDAGGRPVPGANAFGDTDNQLGGRILFPGVYSFGHAATANLVGTLTLDANGVIDPVWIFLASSDLIAHSDSSVALVNGATSCDVFWWVGSSATIGTNSDFVGNIMADQSIALQTGTTLNGSALARIGAVTLDHNTIVRDDCAAGDNGGVSVPDSGSSLPLLGSGLAMLLVLKRRFFNLPCQRRPLES